MTLTVLLLSCLLRVAAGVPCFVVSLGVCVLLRYCLYR